MTYWQKSIRKVCNIQGQKQVFETRYVFMFIYACIFSYSYIYIYILNWIEDCNIGQHILFNIKLHYLIKPKFFQCSTCILLPDCFLGGVIFATTQGHATRIIMIIKHEYKFYCIRVRELDTYSLFKCERNVQFNIKIKGGMHACMILRILIYDALFWM